MRRTVLIAFPFLFLAACSAEVGAENVAGEYALDMKDVVSKMQATMEERLAEMPEDSRVMARQMLGMQFEAMAKRTMHMSLRADGGYRMVSAGDDSQREMKGTWTLRGGEVVATGVEEASGEEDEKVFSIVGDTLVLTEDRSPLHLEMIFRRR